MGKGKGIYIAAGNSGDMKNLAQIDWLHFIERGPLEWFNETQDGHRIRNCGHNVQPLLLLLYHSTLLIKTYLDKDLGQFIYILLHFPRCKYNSIQ